MGLIRKQDLPTQSWVSGVTAALESTMMVRGRVEQIKVKVNNNTGNATATVLIKEADGSATLFNKGTIAENATTVFKALSNLATQDADFDPFLSAEKLQFTVTPSGDPSTSGMTVDVSLYLSESGA